MDNYNINTNHNNNVNNNNVKSSVAPKTRLSVIRRTTMDTLVQINKTDLSNPEFVEGAVLHAVHDAIELENSIRGKGDKWKQLTALLPAQIADILAYSYPIVRIAGAGMNEDDAQVCSYTAGFSTPI